MLLELCAAVEQREIRIALQDFFHYSLILFRLKRAGGIDRAPSRRELPQCRSQDRHLFRVQVVQDLPA